MKGHTLATPHAVMYICTVHLYKQLIGAVLMPAGVLLGLAIVTEVIGTVLLRVSDGFSKPLPSVGVVVMYVISVIFLARVLKELEIGFTYAVWAGIGTAAVAVIGVAAWDEPMGMLKALSLGAVIAGVVGLNLAAAH